MYNIINYHKFTKENSIQQFNFQYITVKFNNANNISNLFDKSLTKQVFSLRLLQILFLARTKLELALKDFFSEWMMNPIATNLQDLYYIYEKLSKKLQELKKLNEILKEVYIFKNNKIMP